MRSITWFTVTTLALLLLGGCASMQENTRQRQAASVLSYLFPGSEQVPQVADRVAEIKVPFRIGVAFVPDDTPAAFRLSEADRQTLSGAVRDSFASYPFVREIVTVPSVYLASGGGFANLDQIGALLDLDVVVLVSYDQVQNSGASGWSFLYWTGVGAYVIKGDRYDILTAVETSVFDIRSRRLLVRASGVSTIKGSATMIGFAEHAREARTSGFAAAMKDMIDKLRHELQVFRERAPNDPTIRLSLPPGYNPGAARPR
jgi:rhombotail lipoprotein